MEGENFIRLTRENPAKRKLVRKDARETEFAGREDDIDVLYHRGKKSRA